MQDPSQQDYQWDIELTASSDAASIDEMPPQAPSLAPSLAPRQQRRLPERILVAAHQACDLGELQVAGSLLSVLEVVLMHPNAASPSAHRRTIEGMVAAYERLWHLRRSNGPST